MRPALQRLPDVVMAQNAHLLLTVGRAKRPSPKRLVRRNLTEVVCARHKNEAIGVCAYCGRGLCAVCVTAPDASRLCCSDGCAKALEKGETAMRSLLSKSENTAKASAYYCFLFAVVSFAASVGAWQWLPSPLLIWFTAGCGVASAISGFWYLRSGRKS